MGWVSNRSIPSSLNLTNFGSSNPYEKALPKPGCEYLDPRGSFERWTETIVGTSREWTCDQRK